MVKKSESAEGRQGAARARKPKRKGRTSFEFVGEPVRITSGMSADETTRIPRDMFQPGPVGDYYFTHQDRLEFDMVFTDE